MMAIIVLIFFCLLFFHQGKSRTSIDNLVVEEDLENN